MNLNAEIEQMKTRLKRGIFDDGLEERAETLWKNLQQTSVRDERFFKAKAMVSEVSFYFDNLALARASVAEFQHFKMQDEDFTDRNLARERIRCYLASIQATLYCESSYEEAKAKIIECVAVLNERLVSKTYRCEGTLAWAHYQLGCCSRQLNLLDQAEESFLRSQRYQFRRAKHRKIELESEPNAGKRERLAYEEVLFCNRRVAIVLGLGLGFCDYTRGRLSKAREKLTLARTLLTYCHDELNDAYLNLLFGSVIRCQAGSDPKELLTAERLVKKSHQTFKKLGHRRYAPRATYELALIHLALADRTRGREELFLPYLDRAREEAEAVMKASSGPTAARWTSHALLVQSRIQRKLGNYDDAIKLATDAFDAGGDQRFCTIDALIGEAEARVAWVRAGTGKHSAMWAGFGGREGLLASAEKNLSDAREQNSMFTRARSPEHQNEKIESVCRLLQARICVLRNEELQAKEMFQLFKEIGRVEHHNIQEFAKVVNAEIQGLARIFHIDSGKDPIDYKLHHKRLQQYFMDLANLRHPHNQAQRAAFINVSRSAIILWEGKREAEKESEE